MFRLRTRLRKIRKNRRSKKPFRKPAVISLIVIIRITNNNSFNTFQKSFRKNHKNSNLFIQKRWVKSYYVSLIKKQRQTAVRFDSYFDENSINHITRILRTIVRINKIQEGLANNLIHLKTTALSLESTMYFLPFSVFMLAFTKHDLYHDLYDVVLPLSENQAFVLTNQWTVLKLVKLPTIQLVLHFFTPSISLCNPEKKLKAEYYDDDNLQAPPIFEEDDNVFYVPEEVYPYQDRLFFSDIDPQCNALVSPFDPSVDLQEAIKHILLAVERTNYFSIKKTMKFSVRVLISYCNNNKNIAYKEARRLFNYHLDDSGNIVHNTTSNYEIIGQSIISSPPETLDAGELNQFLPTCLIKELNLGCNKSDTYTLQLPTAN